MSIYGIAQKGAGFARLSLDLSSEVDQAGYDGAKRVAVGCQVKLFPIKQLSYKPMLADVWPKEAGYMWDDPTIPLWVKIVLGMMYITGAGLLVCAIISIISTF